MNSRAGEIKGLPKILSQEAKVPEHQVKGLRLDLVKDHVGNIEKRTSDPPEVHRALFLFESLNSIMQCHSLLNIGCVIVICSQWLNNYEIALCFLMRCFFSTYCNGK